MRDVVTIRTGTTQATTGQTDAVSVPGWAKNATVYLDVTATAGNTPLADMKFQYVGPALGTALDFQWDGITQIAGTPAGPIIVHIGLPNIDTADDTTPVYFIRDPLPWRFNIVTTLDRTTGNETYTYTIQVEYRG